MDATLQRLVDRWPVLASEIRESLISENEESLATQVDELRIVQLCGCGDSFCQSFYTAPKPNGAYGAAHKNVVLHPPGHGMLILDVVDDQIVYVEVLDREPVE